MYYPHILKMTRRKWGNKLKTTGVSRRIDDLGRIVIPKEIRKRLKIREGELLEILVEDENVILTKHSTMKSMGDIANLCVDAVGDVNDINMLITDRDKVIASSSSLRKKYIDKDLSIEISELFSKHNPTIEREPKLLKIDTENEENTSYAIYPIIIDGDVAGSVIILGNESKISEADQKVAEVISKFLIRNMIQ